MVDHFPGHRFGEQAGGLMLTVVLQDRITIRGSGGSPGTPFVTQGEDAWLNASGLRDVVAWVEVEEVTASGGTITLALQTAVTKDEAAFAAILPAAVVAVGVSVTPMLADVVGNPLAQWLRWQLAASGTSAAWDVTFRVVLATNPAASAVGATM